MLVRFTCIVLVVSVSFAGCVLDTQGTANDPDTGVDIPIPDTFAETAVDVPEDTDSEPELDGVTEPPDDTSVDTVEDTVEEDAGADLPPCDGPTRIYYIDADGDGYGDLGGGVEWCAPPPGFVDNFDDCYDDNDQAHPGQVDFFPVDRGDGSFDYDCDLVETRFRTETTECSEWSCDGNGWSGEVPGCGVTASWRHCYIEWVVFCNVDDSSVQQMCR